MIETTGDARGWPPRPAGESFPPVLDTVLVAQLLLYDRRGATIEQARRNVRRLVAEAGLPATGRIGSALMYKLDDVLDWLDTRHATPEAESA